LSDNELDLLKKRGHAVHERYKSEINALYDGDIYRPKDYLREVQDFMGYKP
jgi:hypothetical protein